MKPHCARRYTIATKHAEDHEFVSRMHVSLEIALEYIQELLEKGIEFRVIPSKEAYE